MRVLIVTNMYPPHHLGGYELACADVVARWRAGGHHVEVLTTEMRLPGVADPPDERALGVRRDLTFYWADHELVNPSVWQRFQRERANERAMRAALDEVAPDVVSAWHMGALNLALLDVARDRGIPVVLNLLDAWMVYERELDAWTRLWRRLPGSGAVVERLTGVHARVPDLSGALHCFCSDLTRQQSAARPVWPISRWEITPLGIDRNDFPPMPPPPERPFGWQILYVGRIERRKGMLAVVRALPLLPADARVQFIGRGDDVHKAEVEALAVELGVRDRIEFGFLPRDQLAEAYRSADVFVFPSEWDEPFGLVPIEAMACGAPVVATGTGGSAEFLRDEDNCLLFRKGDERSLATQLRRLAETPELRRKIVAGGLRTADELTADRYAEQLERLHQAEVTNRSAAS